MRIMTFSLLGILLANSIPVCGASAAAAAATTNHKNATAEQLADLWRAREQKMASLKAEQFADLWRARDKEMASLKSMSQKKEELQEQINQVVKVIENANRAIKTINEKITALTGCPQK